MNRRTLEGKQLTIESTTQEQHPAALTGPWGKLALTEKLSWPNLGGSQFSALVIDGGIPHTAQAGWTTSEESLDAVLQHALTTSRSSDGRAALLDVSSLFGEPSLVFVALSNGSARVWIAAGELVALRRIERWLRGCFPPVQIGIDHRVPVTFWTCGSYGPDPHVRMLDVPSWEDVSGNYPASVRGGLARLVDPSFRPAEGGQLVLWYGPPGTGKTFALRALGWEWREWSRLHYIVDPEVFFGARTDYLLEVVFGQDDDDDVEEKELWRLIVLEDTGELLAADAKERTGQGLSRLLNLVDGIVGQGLRVLVLVTTNEPLQQLHPAVARPGRCAAKIEFAPFAPAEAAAWLQARGTGPAGAGPATLADLFARLAGTELEPARPLGFSAPSGAIRDRATP
jgi:hypothetical protein